MPPNGDGDFIAISRLSCAGKLARVQQLLTSASEVAVTLTFCDESSQLRSNNKVENNLVQNDPVW